MSNDRWYLEPLDSQTNASAMAELARTCGATDDRIHYKKPDNLELPHNVVEVPYAFISEMVRSRSDFAFKFNAFRQRAGNARMTLWGFLNSKRKESAKMKKARAGLEAQKGRK